MNYDHWCEWGCHEEIDRLRAALDEIANTRLSPHQPTALAMARQIAYDTLHPGEDEQTAS